MRSRPTTMRPRLRPKMWSRDQHGLETLTSQVVGEVQFPAKYSQNSLLAKDDF